MGKSNNTDKTQMDFSPYLSDNKKDGFYPKSLTTPLIAFGVIVVVLFFVAILLCRGGVPDCCKGAMDSNKSTAHKAILAQDEPPKDTEKIRDDKVGATTALSRERPKEAWQIAQERFLAYNDAYEKYTMKESLFFDKNSSFLGAKQQADFTRNLKDNLGEARLAIIFGYGCDLGDEKYNILLIDKRINRVVEAIAKQYPHIKILSSNEGKAKVSADEKTRQYERRVDIYFY